MRMSSVLGATVASVLLASLVTAPALADSEVGLSFDGQHWADELRRPLFDTDRAWVPGDAEMRSFFVRDDGPTDARMTIQLVARDGNRLMSLGDVELSARQHGGTWHPLDLVGSGTALLDAPLDQDVPVQIDVRARLRWAARNDVQSSRLPLDLVVTLTQAGSDGTGGFIPGTGNAVESWVVVLGVMLVGGGVALLVLRRRREQADG